MCKKYFFMCEKIFFSLFTKVISYYIMNRYDKFEHGAQHLRRFAEPDRVSERKQSEYCAKCPGQWIQDKGCGYGEGNGRTSQKQAFNAGIGIGACTGKSGSESVIESAAIENRTKGVKSHEMMKALHLFLLCIFKISGILAFRSVFVYEKIWQNRTGSEFVKDIRFAMQFTHTGG